MDVNIPELFKLAITVIFSGGGGGLFVWWLKYRAERRAEARDDRAEPLALSKGVAELTDLLTTTARKSVEEAQKDLVATRAELQQARDELRTARSEITKHQTLIESLTRTIDRLTRRVNQLVDLLGVHQIPVPEEED